jgi:tripartite-type tricarboxylate transporter receptor subunit TctC
MTMRRVLLALLLPLAIGPARAENYPSRAVEIIVPFAAGGGTDIIARIVADRLSESLKARFVVVNRPGASTNIGTAAAAVAPADGYTLLMPASRSPPTPRSIASSPTGSPTSRRSP